MKLTINQKLLLRTLAGESLPRTKRYRPRNSGNIVPNQTQTQNALARRGLIGWDNFVLRTEPVQYWFRKDMPAPTTPIRIGWVITQKGQSLLNALNAK